jgi:hypothetical protein
MQGSSLPDRRERAAYKAGAAAGTSAAGPAATGRAPCAAQRARQAAETSMVLSAESCKGARQKEVESAVAFDRDFVARYDLTTRSYCCISSMSRPARLTACSPATTAREGAAGGLALVDWWLENE